MESNIARPKLHFKALRMFMDYEYQPEKYAILVQHEPVDDIREVGLTFTRRGLEADGFAGDKLEEKLNELSLSNGAEGSIISFNDSGYRFLHIIYESFDPTTDLFILGHEETHALHMLDRLDLLNKLFSKYRLMVPDFPSYDFADKKEKEILAHLGGFLALKRRGIAITKRLFPKTNIGTLNYVEPALDLWFRGMKNG